MTIRNPAIKFTYEDYRNTSDDERCELLDGEFIMAPAPSIGHQRIDTRASVVAPHIREGKTPR